MILIGEWLNEILVVLGLATTVLGKVIHTKHKIEQELSRMIDQSGTKNEDFIRLAEKLGLKKAVNVMKKIMKV